MTSSVPSLDCPNCAGKLEYQITIEMLDPPVGKIDTGYCPRCARLFERIREANQFYDSTSWPPVCRICRQPVSFAGVGEGEEGAIVRYTCRDHPGEQWEWTRRTERWTRIA